MTGVVLLNLIYKKQEDFISKKQIYVSETSFNNDTTYQDRGMGIRKSKEKEE